VLLEYHRLQHELVRTRNHRRPHQTPIEHGLRFAGRDARLDAAFLELHRLVYGALYGERESSEAETLAARRSSRRIRRELG
jgi:hypothetical protein